MNTGGTFGQYANRSDDEYPHRGPDPSTDDALRWDPAGDIDPIDVLCRRIVMTQPCNIPASLALDVEADIRCCVAALDPTFSGDAVAGLYHTLASVGGRPESRVGGQDLRLPAHDAATLNVAACRTSDRDAQRFIAPAVWSASATSDALGGVSPEAYTTAIALSIDLGCRLLQATPDAEVLGHHGAIYSGFVAAACAAKLRGLSAHDLTNALGIMLCQAAGTRQASHDPASGDDLLIALSVGDGLKSVMLATVGVTGVRRVMSGEFGFLNLFSKRAEERVLISDLKQMWGVRGRYPLACGNRNG